MYIGKRCRHDGAEQGVESARIVGKCRNEDLGSPIGGPYYATC